MKMVKLSWYGRQKYEKRWRKTTKKGLRTSDFFIAFFWHFHKINIEFQIELLYKGNIKSAYIGIGFLFFTVHAYISRFYNWIPCLRLGGN
jgi:hypothetical protein